MKTQTQQASYREAVRLLVDLEREISAACFTVQLRGSNDIWGLTLLGWDTPYLNSLVRVFNLQRDSHYDVEDESGGQRGYKGHHGRTQVELAVCYTKVVRLDGLTGLPVSQPGLW